MDHQPTAEQASAAPAVQGNSQAGASRTAPPSVSAGIAAVTAHQPKPPEAVPRFPGEDGGRSLAAMAYRDLDAALQLLAERAQYITGAHGAVIALRRGEYNDMLCRASAGSNAPELGALLSMEYGFSGESVRSRQALRCDNTEMDPRVNREGCRQLGIASVVAMPILSDQQVLGVFELFSGKPHAFAERDVSALQRLSGMVETAVKYAVAAQSVPTIEEPPTIEEERILDEAEPEILTKDQKQVLSPALNQEEEQILDESPFEAPRVEANVAKTTEPSTSAATALPPSERENPQLAPAEDPSVAESLKSEPKKIEAIPAEPVPRKPLFWSAEMQSPGNPSPSAAPESTSIPEILRNFHKCEACGFPVSQGRTFCVECEEKQWRGQPLPQSAPSAGKSNQSKPGQSKPTSRAIESPEIAAIETASSDKAVKPSQAVEKPASSPPANPLPAVAAAVAPTFAPSPLAPHAPAPAPAAPLKPQEALKSEPAASSNNAALFLSATVESESWLSANKYILGALVLVAIVITTIMLMH